MYFVSRSVGEWLELLNYCFGAGRVKSRTRESTELATTTIIIRWLTVSKYRHYLSAPQTTYIIGYYNFPKQNFSENIIFFVFSCREVHFFAIGRSLPVASWVSHGWCNITYARPCSCFLKISIQALWSNFFRRLPFQDRALTETILCKGSNIFFCYRNNPP